MRGVVDGFIRLVIVAAAGFLIFSGAVKLDDLGAFRSVLADHGLVPARVVPVLAVFVPVAEAVVGAIAVWMLATSNHAATAALVLGLCFAAFTTYAFALYLWPQVQSAPCGCFGSKRLVEDWAPITLRDGIVTLVFLTLAARTARPLVEQTSAESVTISP